MANELPELTKEEIRNGWTPESLQAYLEDCQRMEADHFFNRHREGPDHHHRMHWSVR